MSSSSYRPTPPWTSRTWAGSPGKVNGDGEKGGQTWESTLSVGELTALGSVGLVPGGVVQATTVAPMPTAPSLTWQQQHNELHRYPCPHGGAVTHLDGYTYERRIYEKVPRRALETTRQRLSEQAAVIGAHGVVVTHLRKCWVAGPTLGVSVSMAGTAVSRPGAPCLPEPFTTYLSGTDLAKALRAGWVPTDLVATVASVAVDAGCATVSQRRIGSVGEVVQLGEAMTACRRLVVEDLEAQASRRGDGVVAVEVQVNVHEADSRSPILEGWGVGTAVRSFARCLEPVAPLVMLDLRDRRTGLGTTLNTGRSRAYQPGCGGQLAPGGDPDPA